MKKKDEIDNLLKKGGIFYKNREFSQAINEYKKVIVLDPNNAVAFFNCGMCYGSNNELDKSIDFFTKAIELDRFFVKAYFHIGYINYVNEEYDQAIVNYTKAIELAPNYAEAYHNRAMSYAAKGDWDNAQKDKCKYDKLR